MNQENLHLRLTQLETQQYFQSNIMLIFTLVKFYAYIQHYVQFVPLIHLYCAKIIYYSTMADLVENAKEVKGQQVQQGDQNVDRAEFHNLVDILFVIDTTSSMSWCIRELKKTVCKIMKKFGDKQYNIKFALSLYRDHPPQEYSYVQKHFDLQNEQEIIKIIEKHCQVCGGGDGPEAVFDGLVQGLKKTSWRVSSDGKTRSKRFVYHGCDAPPHGNQYGGHSSDPKWGKDGCPCGLNRQDVKNLLDQHNVDYSLIKCGHQADVMSTLFKQCFGQRFKRELEILQHSNKRYSYYEDDSDVHYQRAEITSQMDVDRVRQGAYQIKMAEKKEKKSFFQSIKNFFTICGGSAEEHSMPVKEQGAKKVERKRAIKPKKQIEEEKNSSDEQEGRPGRPRSMASLVCSGVEQGIQDYFDQPIKKPTQTKDI